MVDTCSSHYSNSILKGIGQEEGWVGEERSICYHCSNTTQLVDTLSQ